MKDRLPSVVVYLCIFLMTAASIFYSNYTARENGRKFCDIISTVNDAYKDPNLPPPTTELGEKLKQNYAELEDRLDC